MPVERTYDCVLPVEGTCVCIGIPMVSISRSMRMTGYSDLYFAQKLKREREREGTAKVP